jgi:hypothetical protein
MQPQPRKSRIFSHLMAFIKRSTLQRKSHLCIPFLGIARRLSLYFHVHVSVIDLYIPRFGSHIFLQQSRQIDRGNIQITHRHVNVEIGTVCRAIPFLGICVSNFRYWFFAMYVPYSCDPIKYKIN